jgi:IMP dehydrogenase
VIRAVRRVKSAWPNLPVIAGNVVTEEGTLALIEAGVDAVKVGIGAGSICTTRMVSGAGMPQMSAIFTCARAAAKKGIPVIADGGVKYSGDIVKAIVAGAETVMLGSLLAGLEESPGEVILYEGRQYKSYRGMGSLGALQGFGRDRYATGQGSARKLVPEGVEGMVPYKGLLSEYVYQLVGGLRSGMGYSGARSLDDLRLRTRLVMISNAGLLESSGLELVSEKIIFGALVDQQGQFLFRLTDQQGGIIGNPVITVFAQVGGQGFLPPGTVRGVADRRKSRD